MLLLWLQISWLRSHDYNVNKRKMNRYSNMANRYKYFSIPNEIKISLVNANNNDGRHLGEQILLHLNLFLCFWKMSMPRYRRREKENEDVEAVEGVRAVAAVILPMKSSRFSIPLMRCHLLVVGVHLIVSSDCRKLLCPRLDLDRSLAYERLWRVCAQQCPRYRLHEAHFSFYSFIAPSMHARRVCQISLVLLWIGRLIFVATALHVPAFPFPLYSAECTVPLSNL